MNTPTPQASGRPAQPGPPGPNKQSLTGVMIGVLICGMLAMAMAGCEDNQDAQTKENQGPAATDSAGPSQSPSDTGWPLYAKKLPRIELPDPIRDITQAPDDVTKVIVNVVGERQQQNINGKMMEIATGDIIKLVVDGIEYHPQDYGPFDFAKDPKTALATEQAMCEKITEQLKDQKSTVEAKGKTVEVILRADKGVYFDLVAPVMQSITSAGIVNVTMTARLDSKLDSTPADTITLPKPTLPDAPSEILTYTEDLDKATEKQPPHPDESSNTAPRD